MHELLVSERLKRSSIERSMWCFFIVVVGCWSLMSLVSADNTFGLGFFSERSLFPFLGCETEFLLRRFVQVFRYREPCRPVRMIAGAWGLFVREFARAAVDQLTNL